MTWDDWVVQVLQPRATAALQSIRSALLTAGVPDNRITISMPNIADWRLQIVVNPPGGRTATAYIEVTDTFRFGGPSGRAYLTLGAQTDGGVSIAHNYSDSVLHSYTEDGGLDELTAKLAQLEDNIPLLLSNIKTYLRV